MINRILLKRSVGFSLMVVGLLLFYLFTPTAVSSDLIIITLTFSWLIVILLGFGSSLLFDLGLKYSLKVLVLVFAFMIPWSIIFYISLPYDSGLLVVILAGIIILLYRRHQKSHDHRSQQKACNFTRFNRRMLAQKFI